MRIDAFGLTSVMVLDLQPNGQLAGSQSVLGFNAPLGGVWAYNPQHRMLDLQLVAQVMGLASQDRIQIFIVGAEGGVLFGRDLSQRGFTLQRL